MSKHSLLSLWFCCYCWSFYCRTFDKRQNVTQCTLALVMTWKVHVFCCFSDLIWWVSSVYASMFCLNMMWSQRRVDTIRKNVHEQSFKNHWRNWNTVEEWINCWITSKMKFKFYPNSKRKKCMPKRESLCLNTAIMNNYRRMSWTHAELSCLLLINPPKDVRNGRSRKIAKEEMKRQLQRGVINNKQSWKEIGMKKDMSQERKRGSREERDPE